METITLPKQVVDTSKVLTPVYITENYDMFGHLGGNRNLDTSNLNKIKQSITKKHIKTNAVICIIDNNDLTHPLKIVDGQHRFEACKTLNIPVSYVIDHTLSLDTILNDITLLNTASKEWDVSDFMRSEAKKGNQNYILYSTVYNQFDKVFDHEALFYILNNDSNRTEPKISYPNFKNGELLFTIFDSSYLLKRLSDISKFNEYNEIGGKRYYQKALNQLFNTKGFDDNHMLNRLKSRKSHISKCTTVDGAIRQLSEIYNYKLQIGKVQFITEGTKILDLIIR